MSRKLADVLKSEIANYMKKEESHNIALYLRLDRKQIRAICTYYSSAVHMYLSTSFIYRGRWTTPVH